MRNLKYGWRLLIGLILMLCLVACTPAEEEPTPTVTSPAAETALEDDGPDPTTEPSATPTTTPTPTSEPVIIPTETPEPSPCEGVTGSLEVRILVGPAEVVGLEPEGVGEVPFTVSAGEDGFTLTGGGSINYNEVYVEDEVNYDVTFTADLMLDGICDTTGSAPQLVIDMGMAWEQILEVTARDFHEIYPMAGDSNEMLTFPLEDGATINLNEGAVIVLHLGK